MLHLNAQGLLKLPSGLGSSPPGGVFGDEILPKGDKEEGGGKDPTIKCHVQFLRDSLGERRAPNIWDKVKSTWRRELFGVLTQGFTGCRFERVTWCCFGWWVDIQPLYTATLIQTSCCEWKCFQIRAAKTICFVCRKNCSPIKLPYKTSGGMVVADLAIERHLLCQGSIYLCINFIYPNKPPGTQTYSFRGIEMYNKLTNVSMIEN